MYAVSSMYAGGSKGGVGGGGLCRDSKLVSNIFLVKQSTRQSFTFFAYDQTLFFKHYESWPEG
jgi:hypothetical protein